MNKNTVELIEALVKIGFKPQILERGAIKVDFSQARKEGILDEKSLGRRFKFVATGHLLFLNTEIGEVDVAHYGYCNLTVGWDNCIIGLDNVKYPAKMYL